MDMSQLDNRHSKGYRIAVAGAKNLLRILALVAFVAVLFFAGRWVYSLGYETFSATPVDPKNGTDIVVTITSDMTGGDIAELLNRKGLINESIRAFELQQRVYGFEDTILPGEYTLNTSQTVREMMEIMSTPPEEETP